jgi:predicted flap endonuclease-1-like 5' DNA nuclease
VKLLIVIEEAQPTEPDDLTLVEGIGPKTSSALQNAGINTYTQLAASDTDTLKGILKQAGVRVAVSDTWTEQAGLAAAGDWNALEALQAGLKGGRRDS